MTSKVLFINITRQCNVDCHRCYLTPDNRKSPDLLPHFLIEKSLSSQFFQKADKTTIIWQGGEPTIAGKDYILKAIQIAKNILPDAKQTMVTNLYNLPAWLIDIAKEFFDSAIETTYAVKGKASLDGNESRFQQNFIRSLAKAIDCGLTVPVNVELNKETALIGPENIFDLAEKTGNKNWEFDISIDFEYFRRKSSFADGHYPLLKSTLPYTDFSNYLLSFAELNSKLQPERRLSSSVLEAVTDRSKANTSFNVLKERDFLTINPDGTITTNPLFSDIVETYLGNLNHQTLDECTSSIYRHQRLKYEMSRIESCFNCAFFSRCRGGPSHAELYDGSGECAGMKAIWNWGLAHA